MEALRTPLLQSAAMHVHRDGASAAAALGGPPQSAGSVTMSPPTRDANLHQETVRHYLLDGMTDGDIDQIVRVFATLDSKLRTRHDQD